MSRRKDTSSIDEQGRTRSAGLMWVGGTYPVPAEIVKAMEYAKARGWRMRIHIEPPGVIQFYVTVPAGIVPPDGWIPTVGIRGFMVQRGY